MKTKISLPLHCAYTSHVLKYPFESYTVEHFTTEQKWWNMLESDSREEEIFVKVGKTCWNSLNFQPINYAGKTKQIFSIFPQKQTWNVYFSIEREEREDCIKNDAAEWLSDLDLKNEVS